MVYNQILGYAFQDYKVRGAKAGEITQGQSEGL